MVLLTVTATALEALEARRQLAGEPTIDGDLPSLTEANVGDPISHRQLVDLSRFLLEHGTGTDKHQWELECLLKGARVYTPPVAAKPSKSPEYVKLMARLREEEERRAYERMINPPPVEPQTGLGTFGSSIFKDPVVVEVDDATFSDINRQMTLIINVLVTIIACSVGIWVTAWHWATPARLALSLLGSGAIGVAEVVIYLGYIKRVSDAKHKEAKLSESKEVVDTWVIDGSSGRKVKGRDEGMRHRKGKHS